MAPPSIVLGIFGPQRAGKNEVVSYLVNHHNFVSLSISAPIKRLAHTFAGCIFTDAEKDVPQPRLNGRTPRELYIQFGQLDEYAPNLFVDFIIEAMNGLNGTRFVIESVGKQAQWDRILDIAKPPVKALLSLTRPGCEWKDTRQVIADYQPVFHIDNNSDVAALYNRVGRVVPMILESRPRKRSEVEGFIGLRPSLSLPSADTAIRNMLRATSPR